MAKCKVIETFSDTVQSMFDRLSDDFVREHHKTCGECRDEHEELQARVKRAFDESQGKKATES
jgi:predicted anti-sigma-YlaC factor YlaD